MNPVVAKNNRDVACSFCYNLFFNNTNRNCLDKLNFCRFDTNHIDNFKCHNLVSINNMIQFDRNFDPYIQNNTELKDISEVKDYDYVTIKFVNSSTDIYYLIIYNYNLNCKHYDINLLDFDENIKGKYFYANTENLINKIEEVKENSLDRTVELCKEFWKKKF